MIAKIMKAALFALIPMTLAAVEPPAPYGPVPSARQLQWHEMEVYGFLHFSVNTFTDLEWGNGDEAESVFNPTDFDANQIVSAAKAGGLKGLILTAKHHDGFCLWPSKFTEHSVKKSPWKDGKGDVVKEVSEACRRQGLQFGVYLSPWDRNHAEYGRPGYIPYFRNQLRELLTGYGPLFEIWFDGANGGTGYYGGKGGRRNIDRKTYYDWKNTWQMIRELQPGACIWSDAGPDVRWVGNESGHAGDPCWATVTADDWCPGNAPGKFLNSGMRDGKSWIPAEVDVSIRPAWFYHTKDDSRVRSSDNLTKIYFESVGRGASLLLNIPPDRRGRVHDNDVKALKEFGERIDTLFARNLLAGAKIDADAGAVRGGDARFAPANLLDGKRDTYWSTDDAVTTSGLIFRLEKPVSFNVVALREYLPLGERIEGFSIEAKVDGAWKLIGRGTAIGSRRLLRVPATQASEVRLRITASPVCPALAEFGLYLDAAQNASSKERK